MPSDPQDTDSSATAQSGWSKDLVGITPFEILGHVSLDEPDVVRPYYENYRKSVIQHLQMKGPNLFDLLLNYASNASGSTAFAPQYRFDDLQERKGLGKKFHLSTATNLRQPDVRFRAKNIMLAFLPMDCTWREDLENFPKDRPILGFIQDLDDEIFAFDRKSMLLAQTRFVSQRWKKSVKLSEFFRQYHDLVKDHEAHNDQELDAYNYWDQLVINLTDQDSDYPAEGFVSFRSEMQMIDAEIIAGGNQYVTFSKIKKFKAQLISAERELRKAGLLPKLADPVVNATQMQAMVPASGFVMHDGTVMPYVFPAHTAY